MKQNGGRNDLPLLGADLDVLTWQGGQRTTRGRSEMSERVHHVQRREGRTSKQFLGGFLPPLGLLNADHSFKGRIDDNVFGFGVGTFLAPISQRDVSAITDFRNDPRWPQEHGSDAGLCVRPAVAHY